MAWNKTSQSRKRTSNTPKSISQRRIAARRFGETGSSGDWLSAGATGRAGLGWSALITLAGPTAPVSKDNSLESGDLLLALDAPQRISRARQEAKMDVFVSLGMVQNIICKPISI